MVFVWMSRNHDINGSVVKWHHTRKLSHDGAIGASVNEHLAAVWRLDKNCVSLPDIKKCNDEHSASLFGKDRGPDKNVCKKKRADNQHSCVMSKNSCPVRNRARVHRKSIS